MGTSSLLPVLLLSLVHHAQVLWSIPRNPDHPNSGPQLPKPDSPKGVRKEVSELVHCAEVACAHVQHFS